MTVKSSPPLLGSLPLLPVALFTLSALLTYHFHPTTTAFTSPKHPLTLHHFGAPNHFLLASLYVPRSIRAPLFLPPVTAACLSLLGTTSPTSPAVSYSIGTAAIFLLYHAYMLLLFTPPPPERPTSFLDAIHLLTDNRGIGEEWSIPLPALPPTFTSWLSRRLIHLTISYIGLDALTYLLRKHLARYFTPLPYHLCSTTPAPFLPPFGFRNPEFEAAVPVELNPPISLLQYIAYTFMAGLAIIFAILGSNTFLQLVYVSIGLLLRLPENGWFGWRSHPDVFGPFSHIVGFHGIRGFWGRGWHGLFRRSFCAPVEWAFPNPGRARTVALTLVPFVLSGLLHIAGVWTATDQAGRGWGAMEFFLLQPVGMVLEAPLVAWAKRGDEDGMWNWRKGLVGVWTLMWVILSAYGFVEEYRWSGIWWTEPVPWNLWKTEGRKFNWGGEWTRAANKDEGGIMGERATVVN